ncbi:nucleotidyltransferase domain-containing protein [Xanthomonas cannabis]|uniref:nucleotidyltransferase domain-containing protein n=1 Tax=Xanthomonas cannabis TaxID=1885674 RepID=UPI001111A9C5|nr:nucleotidyltransferase domain-containing protein [Xanthomonas cannabis]
MDAAIFGSTARGADDISSDLDVIAVLDEAENLSTEQVELELQKLFKKSISLSIYTKRRMLDLWLEGSPFAWHLYLEARPLNQSGSRFLGGWGNPSKYVSWLEDCTTMLEIVESCSARLASPAVNCDCYEAGLLYVGARNIGMFSSLPIKGSFDFSRRAPFSLGEDFNLTISEFDYIDLVAARHASTRGLTPPKLNRENLKILSHEIYAWGRGIISTLSGDTGK